MSSTGRERSNQARLARAANGGVRISLHLKAVRIAILDKHGNPVRDPESGGEKVASGAILDEDDGFYLLTCWHVVTGIDPRNPKLPGVASPERPMHLRVSMQEHNIGPVVSTVGGELTFELALYDRSSTPPRPLWKQDVESIASEALDIAGIAVPRWHDAVIIKLPSNISPSISQSIAPVDCPPLGANVTEHVHLVGFPYGYSVGAGINQPTAVVLTRSVAARKVFGTTQQIVLLDGGGAPGMSGGPVFKEAQDGRLYFFGLYTGVVYPDGPRRNPERTTALGLVCQFLTTGNGIAATLRSRKS